MDVVGLASDNHDSTYAAQLTIYRAGSYTLEVTINNQHVLSSPWSTLKVQPTDLYAPSCIVEPLSVATSMVAGTQYTFLIQTRDFYSNNKNQLLDDTIGTSYQILYFNEDTSVEALLVDSLDSGVFDVQATLT